jgi:hypothetical protein
MPSLAQLQVSLFALLEAIEARTTVFLTYGFATRCTTLTNCETTPLIWLQQALPSYTSKFAAPLAWSECLSQPSASSAPGREVGLVAHLQQPYSAHAMSLTGHGCPARQQSHMCKPVTTGPPAPCVRLALPCPALLTGPAGPQGP